MNKLHFKRTKPNKNLVGNVMNSCSTLKSYVRGKYFLVDNMNLKTGLIIA